MPSFDGAGIFGRVVGESAAWQGLAGIGGPTPVTPAPFRLAGTAVELTFQANALATIAGFAAATVGELLQAALAGCEVAACQWQQRRGVFQEAQVGQFPGRAAGASPGLD